MRARWQVVVVVFLCLSIVGLHRLAAQQATTVSGYVVDPSGAAIPNARVTLRNVATNVSRQVTADHQGHYTATAVSAGTYIISASAPGFKTTVQRRVVVNLGAQLNQDIKLQVGSATQSISVNAAAAHLQTNTGALSDVVTGQQIQKIAINGRNFMQLAQLVPGASQGPSGFSGIGHLSTGAVQFNGLRSTSNSWMIDGADDLDPGSNGSLAVSPPPDALAQFRVETSNYSAAYGHAGGAVVNVRLKSGTNSFHGSAYEFVRNDALDATDAFLKAKGQKKSPLKLNDFGFTIGGPIKRNKLFFFYSQEFRRLRSGHTFNTHTPSPAELAGNFTGPKTPLPKSKKLSLPPGVSSSCMTGTNTFDPSCFNSNALALIKAGIFPAQTVAQTSTDFNNYIIAASVPTNYHQELLRMDYTINSRLHLMGHFIHEGYDTVSPTSQWTGGTSFPTVQTNFAVPSKNAIVRLTQIISPTLLNETDFQFSDDSDDGKPIGTFTRPSGFSTPTLYNHNQGNRIPGIHLSQGYGGFDVGRWPYALNTPLYSLADTFTQTLGNHTFTYGGMFQFGSKNQPNETETEGIFGFNGQFTGNPLLDYLFGYPNSYTEGSNVVVGQWRYNQTEAFFEDDAKVTPTLTINAGVRYYLIPHAYTANNGVTTWLPQLFTGVINHAGASQTIPCTQSSGSVCTYSGIAFAGTNGVPRTMTNTYHGDIAPRIGFAWQPFGSSSNTVIRGGYGITYYRVQGNDSYNILTNPPVVSTTSLSFLKTDSTPQLNSPVGGKGPSPSPVSLQVLDQRYKPPMIQQYSLGIQHQFTPSTILTVSYVGSDGRHLSNRFDANQPYPFTCPSSGLTVGSGSPACAPGVTYQFNPALNANKVQINTLRPYLGYGSIQTWDTVGSSEYNSLQVDFEKQMTRNLRFQVAYTLSRSLDNAPGLNNDPQNSYNRNAEWAQSNWNRPNVLIANYVWNLPFFRRQHGVAGETLGGWTWSGITTVQSGTPFSVGLSGSGHGLAGRANEIFPANYPQVETNWFCTSCFAVPAPGFFGTSGRNILRGPGLWDFDMTFGKNFRIGEHVNAAMQFAFFNIFNHVNLNNPNAALGSSNFGEITGDVSPRIAQVGIDLSF